MASNHNGNGHANFTTARLDLATKLAIVSALLFDGEDLARAVKDAERLIDLCDAKAKALKEAA